MRTAGITSIPIVLLLLYAITPALADVITLQCIYTRDDPVLAGRQFTVDFDVSSGVVRIGNSIEKINQVTDRYIYYGRGPLPGMVGSPWRLDRRTGVIEGNRVYSSAFTNTWGPQSNCQRVQERDILR